MEFQPLAVWQPRRSFLQRHLDMLSEVSASSNDLHSILQQDQRMKFDELAGLVGFIGTVGSSL